MNASLSGGCQCGAVRYAFTRLGRPSICHCRMCQKAFGGFLGPLVTAYGLTWTRGKPQMFASSNVAKRGFCQSCGTPLCYDWGGDIEIAIGTLDAPGQAAPQIHVNLADKFSFVDRLHALPTRTDQDEADAAKFLQTVISHQHPDADTPTWPHHDE